MKEKIKIFYNKEKDNFILDLITSMILVIISLLLDNIFLFTYALLRVPFYIIYYVIKYIVETVHKERSLK